MRARTKAVAVMCDSSSNLYSDVAQLSNNYKQASGQVRYRNCAPA